MSLSVRSFLIPAVLLAAAAQATTLLAQDVPALTKSSSAVVRGTVKSIEARWSKDGGRIMTDVVLDVSETWVGTPLKTVTVMQPGGVVGEVGQQVHGTARFAVGEEVVVFLEPRGGNYLVTGMFQGKFRVETSSDGKARYARQDGESEATLVDPATRQATHADTLVLPLDTLRSQVLAAAGAKAPVEPVAPGPVKVTP